MICTSDKCAQGKHPCPTPDECTDWDEDPDMSWETLVWFVIALVVLFAAIGLAAGVITSPEFFTK